MSTWFGSFPRSLLPVGAAMILMAAPVAAQEADAEPEDPDCVCLRSLSAAPAMRAFSMARRATLGVVLGEPIEVGGRNGVRLNEVRDGSPAGRAGLRAGDVVVALDGSDLGRDPAAGIVDIMGEVEPGDTVTATYIRGEDERTARIVTGPASLFAFGEGEGVRMRVRGAPHPAMMARPHAPRMVMREMTRPAMVYRHFMRGGPELTAVNPELGSYFGTDRGVLVTDIDADSPLGLRAGDVVLAIDGREVEDPAHVRAILASYRDGEDISFRVVRERRTIDVTGQSR